MRAHILSARHAKQLRKIIDADVSGWARGRVSGDRKVKTRFMHKFRQHLRRDRHPVPSREQFHEQAQGTPLQNGAKTDFSPIRST